MNIEEMKQVAEMIGGLGDKAGASFQSWIFLQVFESVLGYAVFLTVIFCAYRILKPFVINISEEYRATTTLKIIRDELGIGTPGHLSDCEIKNILAEVRKKNA